MPHRVLIVDADSEMLASTAKILSDAEYLVTMASSFEEAKQRLALARPDLLIADVRLGDYNGLHLVLRGRADYPEMAAIVTHVARDRVLEAEATTQGAVYLVKPLKAPRLLDAVFGLLGGRVPKASTTIARRWPRKQVAEGFAARLGGSEAKVVDLSYGGLCLELAEVVHEALATPLEVSLPAVGLSLRTRLVWTKHAEPAGPWWYGVELEEVDPRAAETWRGFVDAVN